MTIQTKNHFNNVLDEVESAPIAHRTDKLIASIANQMQQSGNQELQQWGGELAQLKTQLVRACQQQQGG